jgi:peptide/nickel transport system permease protein
MAIYKISLRSINHLFMEKRKGSRGMKEIRYIFYYFVGILGILFISIIPEVIRDHGLISPIYSVQKFLSFIYSLFDKGTWVYLYKGSEKFIFSFLLEPYLYSVKILLGAILIGFILAFLLAVLTVCLPKSFKRLIKRLLQLLEIIPDLILAFILQLFIVFFYKQTGILLMEFTDIYGEEIVALPIAVLSILPTISFYRVILMYIEEEERKHYVEFAQSKGIHYFMIVIKHILRNIAPNVYYHSKLVVWGALSSLFVIEYLFNIKGISFFMFLDFRPIVLAVTLWLMFTPFYFFYQIVEHSFFDRKFETNTIQKNKESINKVRLVWRLDPKKILIIIRSRTIPQMKPEWHPLKWAKKFWGWLIQLGNGFLPYFRNVKFLGGFVFLSGIVLYSILYSTISETPVNQKMFLYNAQGEITAVSPHPPSNEFLLGTNVLGYSILDQIVVGAKSTILFATIIAGLRILLGFILAVPYAYLIHGKWRKMVEEWVGSLYFLPISIVAYLLLKPILWGVKGDWEFTYGERVMIEIIILTILVSPFLMTLLGNEMKLLLKKTYISSSQVLGGDWWHVLRKHIFPELAPRMGILFGQQMMQVLLILMHLGLFQLFFGGTYIYLPDPPRSVSYEWSGMIGDLKDNLITGPYWMILPILFAFVLSIIALQFMLEGMQEVMKRKNGIYLTQVKKRDWRYKTGDNYTT